MQLINNNPLRLSISATLYIAEIHIQLKYFIPVEKLSLSASGYYKRITCPYGEKKLESKQMTINSPYES